MTPSFNDASFAGLDALLPELEKLYTDIHSHPELSMQETRTAGVAAQRLREAGYEVTTGVGQTGVVGLLRNGDGPGGHAACRHGCVASRGGDRPPIRQQGDGD